MRGAAEMFRRGNGARNEEELTGPLYEEIGRLKMEIDWLKKMLWHFSGEAAGMDRTKAQGIVDRTAVQASRGEPIELLTRAPGHRERKETVDHEGHRPVVSEAAILRSAAHDRLAAGVGLWGQSQTGGVGASEEEEGSRLES
jgi:hypothetical protein